MQSGIAHEVSYFYHKVSVEHHKADRRTLT